MSKESYIRGFCKAAEAAGVDPVELVKLAAKKIAPEGLARVFNNIKISPRLIRPREIYQEAAFKLRDAKSQAAQRASEILRQKGDLTRNNASIIDTASDPIVRDNAKLMANVSRVRNAMENGNWEVLTRALDNIAPAYPTPPKPWWKRLFGGKEPVGPQQPTEAQRYRMALEDVIHPYGW